MVTMQDVAKEAGVSKATVSYVLSGSSLITKETSARVYAAMDKLGYTVNHVARSLSTSRTNTIGIVSPTHQGDSFSLSRGAYLYALADTASAYGYDTLLLTSDGHNEDALTAAIKSRKVDGVIVVDVLNDDPRVEVLRNSRIPSVLLGMPADTDGVAFVDSDFESAAVYLIDVLADAGHREVLLVGWSQDTYDKGMNYALRFRNAAIEHASNRGVQLRMVYSTGELLGSDVAVQEALTAFPDATAMIIHNDAVLISAQQVFAKIGIAVPDDISVVTVVPDQLVTGMNIPFTSMSVNVHDVIRETVSALDKAIRREGEGAVRVLVPTVFRDAHSVGAVSREE